MNTAYLDTLPAIADTKGLQLDMGEKLVFTAPLSMFGTETDQFLGGTGSVLYLTNRRISAPCPKTAHLLACAAYTHVYERKAEHGDAQPRRATHSARSQ